MEKDGSNKSGNWTNQSRSESIRSFLYSLSHQVKDIILWKRPSTTGSLLTAVITLYVMIKFLSFISVIAFIDLIIIFSSFILQCYSSFTECSLKQSLRSYIQRYKKYLFNLVIIQIYDKTSTLNGVIEYFINIFFLNNNINTIIFLSANLTLFFVGMYFNLINSILVSVMVALISTLVFYIPQISISKIRKDNTSKKFDEQNKTTQDIDENQTKNGDTNADEKNQASGMSKTINILLLGESGVGKSTWINGFVNYLTYDSLEEAVQGKPISVIPASFTLIDSDFKEKNIEHEIDGETNESIDKVGESVTQMPKSYIFSMQSIQIRIIDTPGMLDTKGFEKNKENMQNILSHLSQYEEINGIIVLLKPNNSRLDVMFEFCIKELLTHLHKDACKNIVICFTNARGTKYKPGDTMPVLKEFLKRNQTIDIKLTKQTVYCMDNESVRFLMAKHRFEFEESERQDFAVSWKKSVEISKNLVSYISSLEPHAIQKTLCINEIRRSIIEQSRPMAHIAEAIQTNIDEITKNKTIEIAAHKSNVIRIAVMKNCIIMKRERDIFWFHCNLCKCCSNDQMCITYEVTPEVEMVENENIKKPINEQDGLIKALGEHKKQLEDKLKQLKYEKQRLTEINAHFVCFLKQNSIIPYNDALLDCLNYLIKNEKMKMGNGSSPETLDGLVSLKNMYKEEIKAIEDRLKTNEGSIECLDVKDISELLKELKELPYIGGMLKDIMTGVKEANDVSTKLNEKFIEVSPINAVSQELMTINRIWNYF